MKKLSRQQADVEKQRQEVIHYVLVAIIALFLDKAVTSALAEVEVPEELAKKIAKDIEDSFTKDIDLLANGDEELETLIKDLIASAKDAKENGSTSGIIGPEVFAAFIKDRRGQDD